MSVDPNLSEWLYICNNSSTDDLEPLTTLIAPVAIIPNQNKSKQSALKFLQEPPMR